MKKIVTHSIGFLKAYKLYSIIGIVVIFISIWVIGGSGTGSTLETAVVGRSDISEVVSVTGKVTPVKKVNLGFEKGGLVAAVNVKVGDRVVVGQRLGSLDIGETLANLRGAEANLLSEQAKLDELTKGTRPEELAVSKTKATNAQNSYNDALQSLAVALRDAYIRVDNAGRNKTDVFFRYPESTNPTIIIHTENSTIEREINSQRQRFNEMLAAWKQQLSTINTATSTTDFAPYISRAQSNILQAKIYFDSLSSIVNALNVYNSGLSQSAIDTYRVYVTEGQSEIVTGATNLNTAISTMTTTRSTLLVAQNELSLAESGSTPEVVKAQQGKVAQAEANVLSNQSILSKSIITSPIAGVVSKADVEVGEILTAGEIIFSVITDDAYEIEIQVPEADIAKIQVDNTAKITLDAYGSDAVFAGKVIKIDPAETIVEGVPTYTVTLQFNEKDTRIRSGMTANIDIVTAEKKEVLSVPTRAIIDRGREKIVRVAQDGSYIEVKVKTGLKGSNGMTEILEDGLLEGQLVVTFVK